MSLLRIFETEIVDQTFVICPRGDVSTLAGEDVNVELTKVLEDFEKSSVKNGIIDLGKAAYFGSSMLGAMNALWSRVRKQGGKMAICNVSETGLEILHISRFDTLWPICKTREQALEEVAH